MALSPIMKFDVGAVLGECPVWHAQDQALWFTDLEACAIYRLDPRSGEVRSFATPERVGSFGLVSSDPGRLIVAFESGFGFFDLASLQVSWIWRPEAGRTGRKFNDGRVDPYGRFWSGTMVEDPALAAPDSAALYCYDPRAGVQVVESGIMLTNGICFGPTGETFYFADSRRREIYRYGFQAGELGARETFATLETGYPDGAIADVEGAVYSAHFQASRVVRYGPDGRVLTTLDLDVSQPTSVALGGPQRDWLFVTTASRGLDAAGRAREPDAGSILVFQAPAQGLPEGELAND